MNYILDFFCPKLNVGIEVDGESHDEHVEYDKKRTSDLNEIGIKLIRYSNSEVMCNLDGVYLDLEKRIKEREYEELHE